jgi:Xaa-Pro aminopeptidase
MSKKLARLRQLMLRRRVQAYLVPSADPHQSEYVPDCWKRRQFLTGFTGSAGDAVVTLKKAGLWTDSRYYLQAERELSGSGFELFRAGILGVPSWQEWVSRQLRAGETLGLDPKLITHRDFVSLKKSFDDRGLRLKLIESNLVDEVWAKPPAPPVGKVFIHPEKYAGESMRNKLVRLRKKLDGEKAEAHLLSQLDAIAWLFNIRGADVEFNPVVLAYAIITPRKALLFVDQQKMTDKIRVSLLKNSELYPYGDFSKYLAQLGAQKRRVWLDEAGVSQWIVDHLRGAKLIFKPSPIPLFKAAKNKAEIQGARRAHVRDGAAMLKFLWWLKREVPQGTVTELSAAKKLEEFRSRQPLHRGLSFETISSYGSHGAVVHYAVSPATDVPLKPEGIYLIDSGSQYWDATTDITRTVCLSRPTGEQRDRFTRVLKGVISLSTISFPQGTTGPQLDILARRALWEAGLNYGHGTGHGIGAYLNVHEGPQSIAPARGFGVPLESGMILSIEPGFYKEGQYGLRVENLALVVRDEKRSTRSAAFYTFETLTLCPIDLKLVKKELLTVQEIRWLNEYHRRVRRALAPYVDGPEAAWLRRATETI